MERRRIRAGTALLIATLVLPAMVLGAGLLLKKTVLVINDDTCKEIKGEITGHRNVKYQDPNTGVWTDYTMTACKVNIAEKARVSPPSTSTTLAGLSETAVFSKVVDSAGMASVLDKEDAITVFAPSNAAMKKLSSRQLDELMSDRAAARAFVLRHCVLGKRFALEAETHPDSGKLGDGMTGGDRVMRKVSFQSNRPMIGKNSPILIADLDSDKGVIHVIESILEDK
jgi:uncharacterized surface protein with fasciclin (FAS1) repeats